MERAWVGTRGDARAGKKGFPTAAPSEQGRVWMWGFHLAATKGVLSGNLKVGPKADPRATLGSRRATPTACSGVVKRGCCLVAHWDSLKDEAWA